MPKQTHNAFDSIWKEPTQLMAFDGKFSTYQLFQYHSSNNCILRCLDVRHCFSNRLIKTYDSVVFSPKTNFLINFNSNVEWFEFIAAKSYFCVFVCQKSFWNWNVIKNNNNNDSVEFSEVEYRVVCRWWKGQIHYNSQFAIRMHSTPIARFIRLNGIFYGKIRNESSWI